MNKRYTPRNRLPREWQIDDPPLRVVSPPEPPRSIWTTHVSLSELLLWLAVGVLVGACIGGAVEHRRVGHSHWEAQK